MSRANDHAFPIPVVPGLPNGNVDYGAPGMTIREYAFFQMMAAIIASGRQGSSVILDVAAQAREYVDAGLDELEQEPRK